MPKKNVSKKAPVSRPLRRRESVVRFCRGCGAALAPADVSRERGAAAPSGERTIIVKFRDSFPFPYEDGVESRFQKEEGEAWKQLVRNLPGATLRRLYGAIEAQKIQRLVGERVAKPNPRYKGRLLTYFALDYPSDAKIDALLKGLRSWDAVEAAYLTAVPVDPQVSFANNPRHLAQGHLEPAPLGIDAKYAWGIPGGDGGGQEIIDLEQGWTLTHEDLAGQGAQLLFGSINHDSRPHGTSVLGVICAEDNTTGGVGIVPNVKTVNVVSHSGNAANIPNAIFVAISYLTAGGASGGVLVLEVSLQNLQKNAGVQALPCEVDPAIFNAIRFAVDRGVVVVEAAGNGGADLDGYRDDNGNNPLNPDSRGFLDSGAIMVGAGGFVEVSPGDLKSWHARRLDSNYGNRIDCFAWGERVDTTTSNKDAINPATDLYTGAFNGTSSATAIVAGAALSVQGMAEANGPAGTRFPPDVVRGLLHDPNYGTPSIDPSNDKIGVMPDLKKIAAAV